MSLFYSLFPSCISKFRRKYLGEGENVLQLKSNRESRAYIGWVDFLGKAKILKERIEEHKNPGSKNSETFT
jgi:hypothetical protein